MIQLVQFQPNKPRKRLHTQITRQTNKISLNCFHTTFSGEVGFTGLGGFSGTGGFSAIGEFSVDPGFVFLVFVCLRRGSGFG